MENKKTGKKVFNSRLTKFDNNMEPFDLERYEELVEEGLSDSDIANDLNISEEYLQNLKKDISIED